MAIQINKMRLILFIIITLLIVIKADPIKYYARVNAINGTDKYVTPSLNITNSPTWKTMQFALDMTSSFATNNFSIEVVLLVAPGNYSAESSLTNCNLQIIADSYVIMNATNPTININGLNQKTFIFAQNLSLTLIGLKLYNFGNTKSLTLNKMRDLRIQACEFIHNNGLQISDSHNVRFENNTFGGNSDTRGSCINAENCNMIVIQDNFFRDSVAYVSEGGAIRIVGRMTNAIITNNWFIGNTANTMAIYLKNVNDYTAELNMNNVKINKEGVLPIYCSTTCNIKCQGVCP